MTTNRNILIENLQTLSSTMPAVPTADGVDIAALEKSDIDAGREPFYVTLPLSNSNAESRNGRIYVGETLNNAIYEAITQRKVGGNKGHTPEYLRGSFFDVPVAHWVGATIVSEHGMNVVYGKAYIPGDSERMRELRGYYERQAAVAGKVGTSIEGFGFQEWDDNRDGWVITDLHVYRIDIVEGDQLTGIPLAGSRSPVITTEQFSEDKHMRRQLEASQANFRKLVEALRKHPDFADVLYNKAQPVDIIAAVERVTDTTAKEAVEELIFIPTAEQPTPPRDFKVQREIVDHKAIWIEIPGDRS